VTPHFSSLKGSFIRSYAAARQPISPDINRGLGAASITPSLAARGSARQRALPYHYLNDAKAAGEMITDQANIQRNAYLYWTQSSTTMSP